MSTFAAARRRLDLGEREAVRLEPVVVERDPDLLLAAARDADLRDALEPLECGATCRAARRRSSARSGPPLGRDEPEHEHGRLARIEAPHEHPVDVGIGAIGPTAFCTSTSAKSISVSQSNTTREISSPERATCRSRKPRTVNSRCSICSP